jgi:CysZ protein
LLDDAAKALGQMLSPPLRAILWKAVGLALALIAAAAIGLHRLIAWLLGAGGTAVESGLGPQTHGFVGGFAWLLSIVAGLGIIAGSIFLMPVVTAFVGSFFADDIAEEVERVHYPGDPPGVAPPFSLAVYEGGKTALLAVAVYVCAMLLLLIAGFGAVIFFLATAWLLGREYFKLAAMRFHPPQAAAALRKRNAGTVYVGGLLIAAFVTVPLVNLATPLFAMSLMVHVHKRLNRKSAPALAA